MTVSPRRLIIPTILAILAGGMTHLPSADAVEAPPLAVHPHISSAIEERFGGDADGDGLIDMPNTPEYVHNVEPGSCDPGCGEARFDVWLTAAVDGLDIDPASLRVDEFRWSIMGPALPQPLLYSTAYPEVLVSVPEGQYQVTVTADIQVAWATITAGVRGTFSVDDVLVVAIGDSYASGDGNPEVRRRDGAQPRWADSYEPGAAAAHAAAHRSSLAWPARLALTLERADSAASVTFVSVAASGARIDRGLLTPQGGALGSSQIQELQRLVGERTIDLLLIQAGGNDVGFAHAVQALVEADPLLDPVCHDLLVDNVFASVADGDWSRGVSLGYDAPFSVVCRPSESNRGWEPLAGLEGLPSAFARLATSLAEFSVDQTIIVGYPDPTGGDADGATCREIVGDTTPPLGFHEIDRGEQALGVERLLRPLNAALQTAAGSHGWRYVGGIADAFAAGHGYCAPWPDYGSPTEPEGAADGGAPSLSDPDRWFRNPGTFDSPAMMRSAPVTWYRTAAQSAVLQGPGTRHATTGTLHPNEIGHDAIAGMVLAALTDD